VDVRGSSPVTVVGEQAPASPWARSWSRMSPRLRALALAGSVAVFVLLAAWSVSAALSRPAYDRLADLHVYLGAVRAMRHGIPLYSYAAENGDPFTYPPFAALVFWPLGTVPEPMVQVAWTLATVAGVMALAAALTVRNGIAGRQRLLVVLLSAATVLLASAPVQSNLRFGQVSLFVVLLALVDALGLLPRRWGGALIGVAAAIKLTPLLFVPYLWVVGRRRDAVRAGAAFLTCALLALAVWPSSSATFWTRAVFTTSRIGDLSSTGNQSLNGTLLRYAIPTGERMLAWAALAGLVCLVAFLCAREYHRRGQVALAAVVIGCATIAVSPVSWTHHQIWTVLAGILLVAGPRRGRIAAGVIVLVTMSVQVGAVLPAGGFLRDNVRALCAVAVCCGGAISVWQATAGRVRLLPGLAVAGRPRTALLYCTTAAAAIAGMLAVTSDRAVTAEVYAAHNADDPVWSNVLSSTPCAGMGMQDGKWICSDITGPAMGGEQLNFSTGDDGAGRIGIEGQAGPDVVRLAYVPVHGAKPVDVPLWPEPPAPKAAPDMSEPAKFLPVVDRRSMTTHRFAVTTNDATDAELLAYDRAGHLIGTGGDKLHDR
jgi:alpha-1,2-mannosyltransferase